MKRKEIFLHIGFPKTGTSAIQKFLSTNKKTFENAGVLYPNSGLTEYAGHVGLARAAQMKALKPFEILMSEIESSPCQTVVISSEYFFMLEPKKIEFLCEQLSEYKVVIIVYLRRQDRRIESGYLQVLRDIDFRFTGNIDDYISFLKKHPRRTDYFTFLESWSKVFSMDAMRVRVYEEHKGGKRLVSSFLDTVKFQDSPDLVYSREKENVAYKPILNWCLKKINILPLPKTIYKVILLSFNFVTRHFLGEGSIAEHNLLSDKQRKEIIEQYAESNSSIATQYLKRPSGQMFD